MMTVRRIRSFFWGDFDLCPLSRKDFLPQALKIFFIRQPLAAIIAYVSVRIFKYSNTPELLQWIFVIISLTAASCFLIPYCTLAYRRFLGSTLPFPRFIFCAIIAVYLFSPNSDAISWEAVLISCALSGLNYAILFLLPDNDNSSC